MQRYRIVFSKGDETRFLSHLDLLAMWEYSVRRARLPIELALGFNPRPIISLASPLPTGYLGEAEIVEISLTASIPCQEVHGRLRASLPAGITISGV
jgi:radical SAM-linked protein